MNIELRTPNNKNFDIRRSLFDIRHSKKQRMMNIELRTPNDKNLDIRRSLFDIQHSIQKITNDE